LIISQVKDTSYVQEYHVGYKLEGKNQDDVRTIAVDNYNNVYFSGGLGYLSANEDAFLVKYGVDSDNDHITLSGNVDEVLMKHLSFLIILLGHLVLHPFLLRLLFC